MINDLQPNLFFSEVYAVSSHITKCLVTLSHMNITSSTSILFTIYLIRNKHENGKQDGGATLNEQMMT